jgi:crotonobetainyl-CoA:carnitine CoA-transferase CaiB-like acyl-CoA transferase
VASAPKFPVQTRSGQRSTRARRYVPDVPSHGLQNAPVVGPLNGLRVLDLTSVVMGPMATQVLGDLGADVISIESGRGDTNRAMGPGPVRQLSDVSLNLLRNKRNLALDLKAPEGLEALFRVAATCDVLVTNLRPAPLARLGITYEVLRGVRPDIIFCRAQGFPSDSAEGNEPAYDDIIQAAGGVPDVMRRAGSEPSMVPILLADKVSGLVLTYAILAALFHRERTGEGQELEVPMVDALRAFLLVEHGAGAMSGEDRATRQTGYQRILTPDRRPQQTADGWIAVFPYLDAHWETLLIEGGRDDLVGDPRLTREGRYKSSSFAYATLREVMATQTTGYWLGVCRQAGIPATAVADLDEVIDALPIEHHPHAGPYRRIPFPVRFGATPVTVRRHAPLIGEHNREVLAEVGYSDEEIDTLERARVLRTTGAAESVAQGERT